MFLANFALTLILVSLPEASTDFIHSNDTVKISLREPLLPGVRIGPGSTRELVFVLENRADEGKLLLLSGSVQTTDGASASSLAEPFKIRPASLFLGAEQTEEAEMNFETVEEKEGANLTLTLTATLDEGGGKEDNTRRTFKRSVVFTISHSDEEEDVSTPEIEVSRVGEGCDEDEDDGEEEEDCDSRRWEVNFRAKDRESGLADVELEGRGLYASLYPVYYRYANYAWGTNDEQEIFASASCCLERMEVSVSDAAGNRAAKTASVYQDEDDDEGGLSEAAKWTLVGLGTAVALALLLAALCFCCRGNGSSYRSVNKGSLDVAAECCAEILCACICD